MTSAITAQRSAKTPGRRSAHRRVRTAIAAVAASSAWAVVPSASAAVGHHGPYGDRPTAPVVRGAHRPGAAVPVPGATDSVITVKVGGDRSGTAVTPLAGVTLALYANSGDTAPVGQPWAQCVSDADGDCSFVVPDTAAGGGNAGRRFWVAQPPGGAPAGWYADPVLRTGPGSGSGSVRSPYTFQAPALAGGVTYRSTSDFMFSTDWKAQPYVASTGTWVQSRVNPPMAVGCGLDAALVLDLSASVGSALPQLKQAADTFVDALVGTPSRVAVFSFDRTSPSSSVAADHPELTPVSTPAGAAAVKESYAGWTLGKGTNWDQALTAVAQASPHYQAVVVITDGNPTRFANPVSGDGTNTHFADVEGGVFAANAVKAKAERVIALGVGKGVDGDSGLNLAAISGPTAFNGTNYAAADYYQTADYAAAGQVLQQIAIRRCANTVTVVKQIAPPTTTGQDVTGAVPAGPGWAFTATPGTGLTGGPQTQLTTADGTGAVTFTPDFPPSGTTGTLHLNEVQQPGYQLVTRDGHAGDCTDLATGTPVPVTADTTTGATPGFAVDVARGSSLSCTFYNRLAPADITPVKTWSVNGTDYPDGAQPAGLSATAALTGPDSANASPQPWHTARTGYRIGDTAELSETTTVTTPGCRLTGATITAVNSAPANALLPYHATLATAHTVVQVTNTVHCATPPPPVPPTTTTPPPTIRPTPPAPGPTLPATGAGTAIPMLAAGQLLAVAGIVLMRTARKRRA
ncbi:MAG: VWA domain-containing protein [Catenulispora sp.]|nr:VWA domain-containing protein [Catenulispora sp.]